MTAQPEPAPCKVYPVRLTPKTIQAIKVVARLENKRPTTFVREILSQIFDDILEDAVIAKELNKRIEQVAVKPVMT